MILALKLDEGAYRPTKAHDTDAGFDLYAREEKNNRNEQRYF